MAAVAFTPSATEQQLRNTLSEAINSVVQTDIEDLVQTSKLGSKASFEDLRPIFQKTILLFQQLSTANLDCVTEAQLQRLSNQATRTRNEFDTIILRLVSSTTAKQNRLDEGALRRSSSRNCARVRRFTTYANRGI